MSEPGGPCPKFVADVMLGKLAKWLRIAGFDVLYSNRFSDDELVELSQQDERVLLSRDTRLLVRKSVRQFIFLEDDDVRKQVRQVFTVLHTTSLPGFLTRCLSCNELLVEAQRENLGSRVPPYVLATQALFKTCLSCGRIYWAGTHRHSIARTFEKLLKSE